MKNYLAVLRNLPLTFFIVITIFYMQTVEADVVSINAGGTQEIAFTPDKYIEGFFSGTEENLTSPGNGTNGTGGGGGWGGTTTNVSVIPSEFNINLIVNTQTSRIIQIRNLGTTPITFTVSQQNLQGRVSFENNSITIPAFQTFNLNVTFFALDEPGFFTGIINIGGNPVLVAINVKTEFLLFDSNVVVLNENYLVPQGDELKTRVTLIPLGDPERLDVTLLFVIKDYSGKIYLTKSETLLIENLTGLNRDFDTGNLPLGDYIIGLELTYPGGVAPSSAHFQITQRRGLIERIILYLISLILLTMILILFIIIWRRKKKKEEENSQEKT